MVKNKLYAIGSIIEVEGEKLVILGYEQEVVGDTMTGCYTVAPYPVGFMDAESTFLISVKAVDRVIFNGYMDKVFFPPYIKRQEELFDSCEQISAKKLQEMLQILEKTIEKKEEI